ncbi:MAG: ZnF protein [Candidatus Brocadiaceae bacterium]|nr:ZnF protein [Candidatus Brocadiaceae bacterium]
MVRINNVPAVAVMAARCNMHKIEILNQPVSNEQVIDSNVSLYNNVTDTRGKPASFANILEGIKCGTWAELVERLRSIKNEAEQKLFKNTLPCFTASGVFSIRNLINLVKHSDLIAIDIDAKDNPILWEQFKEIRQKLIQDRYTYCLFTSCRGNGLAVVVRIDGTKHLESFIFLEKYYREAYGLVIDKGCKDITRLRFVSYDKDLYLCESADKVQPQVCQREANKAYAEGKEKEIIEAIIRNGVLIGDSYDCWLKIGFAIANTFGEAGRQYFHALSKASPKYNSDACDTKYTNCIKTNRGNVNFGTIIHMAKEAGVVFSPPEWMPNKQEEVTEVTEVTVNPESKIEIPDFPIDIFPAWLKNLVLQISISMGIPASATASMALAILSTAIGSTIKVSPKPSFVVSLFLWMCLVMPTGSGKSPLLNLLTQIIKRMQALSYRQYKDELRFYKNAVRNFKKGSEFPDEPIFEQFLIQDTTVEALSNAFEGQPRGLLSIQDELSGWLKGMNQYKKVGNDKQLYLELYNSGSWSINRKSGVKFIPSTGLGIVGNIQPEIIPSMFENESFADGLIQRIVFVYPDTSPMKYCRDSVKDLSGWNALIDWCYEIPITTDESGFVTPKVLRLEGKALDTYENFYNEYGRLATILPSRYKGFISKLFLYCLKFAGVLHVVEGFESKEILETIPEKTITNAVALTKFYFGQIRLILKLYDKGKAKPLNESQKKFIQILHKLQGEVENGKLLLEKIVDCYNDRIPAAFQLTPGKVSNILKNEMGLTTQKSTGNHSYLIWEYEKIKKYFNQTVTSVTSVTQKADEQEMAATEEIPDVEFVEEIPSV